MDHFDKNRLERLISDARYSTSVQVAEVQRRTRRLLLTISWRRSRVLISPAGDASALDFEAKELKQARRYAGYLISRALDRHPRRSALLEISTKSTRGVISSQRVVLHSEDVGGFPAPQDIPATRAPQLTLAFRTNALTGRTLGLDDIYFREPDLAHLYGYTSAKRLFDDLPWHQQEVMDRQLRRYLRQ